MENFRLNAGGVASILLAWLPDVAALSSLMDVLLKVASLVSVSLIIYLNIKKVRSNAPA